MPSLDRFVYHLKGLHPGNFAMTMASGIIAVGFDLHGVWLGDVFYAIAVGSWLALCLLAGLRLAIYFDAVVIDLTNPRMVFSYFTFVASSDILGVLFLNRGYGQLAVLMWFLAFTVWCVLLYLSFSVLTFLKHEHNVNIVHGGWLIAIVGTQSLVVLGAKVAPLLGAYTDFMLVEIHMLWGLGLVFYFIFVTLFCYRIFFLELKSKDLSPLLWVVMGASAIGANAGTGLISVEATVPFLADQKPFINGVTLMLWSWSTWWIPMLFIFGFWKHIHNREALTYEPVLWSFVFPLGMYAVASSRLGLAAHFGFLNQISFAMIWLAALAWGLTLGGLVRQIARYSRGHPVR